MANLTVRDVPQELCEALKREQNRHGQSLSKTVIDLLSQRLGIGVARSNGLARLAGNWDEDEFRRFEEALEPQ